MSQVIFEDFGNSNSSQPCGSFVSLLALISLMTAAQTCGVLHSAYIFFVFNKELKGSLEFIYSMLTTNTPLHSVLLPQPTDSLKLLCLIYFFPPSLHIPEIESRGKARQLSDSSCFLSLGITSLWCVIFNV